MGSNPAATRNEEKNTLGRPLHRRCPNCAAGSKWKTGDVKPNKTCRKKKKLKIKNLRHRSGASSESSLQSGEPSHFQALGMHAIAPEAHLNSYSKHSDAKSGKTQRILVQETCFQEHLQL